MGAGDGPVNRRRTSVETPGRMSARGGCGIVNSANTWALSCRGRRAN